MATDRFSGFNPSLRGGDEDPFEREADFFSLRWKLLTPLFAILLAFAMIVTYLVTGSLARSGQVAEVTQLQLAARGAQNGMQALYEELVDETTRIAFTQGVVDALLAGDGEWLRRILEAEAIAGDLDGVILLDSDGVEVIHLRRAAPDSRTQYVASGGVNRAGQALALALTRDGRSPATGLASTPEGFMLYVAALLVQDDMMVGQVWVGMRLERVLDALRGSSLAQVALFDTTAQLMQTTFQARDGLYEALTITPEQVQQALSAVGELPRQPLTIAGYPYQAANLRFTLGGSTLGVLAVYLPSSLPYAADLGRQLLGLLMASLAAVVVIAGYGGVGYILGRVGRVTATAQALARGDIGARTHLRTRDEIGELGRSLDVYADRVQQRQESLHAMMRRQRRENARLAAIFESMPDGVVVQDLDGRVLLMNERARELLGSQRAFRSSGFSELTAAVTDVLGPALAPGIYTLGAPQRVPLEGRVLSAQAAAILTISGRRIGTVIVIRDITAQVQQEKAREELLLELSRDVQEPLLELVAVRSPADADPPLQRFAYEVMRHTIRLQRLVTQLRDLADLGPEQLDAAQSPLLVEALVNDLAVEWGPAAQASELELEVMVLQREMYVLGDERRLRWALGNLLDNAIKYTLPGGKITLIVRQQSESAAELIVRDTGVGISAQDQPNLFTRFYRGTPLMPDGSVLRVPGMGQGLFIARSVIQAHGGSIRLESRQGQGTRVICALPLTSPVTMALERQPSVLPESLRKSRAEVGRRSPDQGQAV